MVGCGLRHIGALGVYPVRVAGPLGGKWGQFDVKRYALTYKSVQIELNRQMSAAKRAKSNYVQENMTKLTLFACNYVFRVIDTGSSLSHLIGPTLRDQSNI